MSTVGYGDVGVTTIFGRLVIMVFICIGLVSIASSSHFFLFKDIAFAI